MFALLAHFNILAFLFTHLWVLGGVGAIAAGVAYYVWRAAFVTFITNPKTLLAIAAVVAVLAFVSLRMENADLRQQTAALKQQQIALQAEVKTVQDGQQAVAAKVVIQQQNAKDKAKLVTVIQSSPPGKATDNVLDAIASQDSATAAGGSGHGSSAGGAVAGGVRNTGAGAGIRP